MKKGVVRFTTRILKFDSKGEKTGWTYIDIPPDVASVLMPGNKKSFRVKGMIDKHRIQQVALLPMGDGTFIMPLNAAIRKGIGKRHGAMIEASLEADNSPLKPDGDLMECLSEDQGALRFFNQLPKSHQNYFSKWISSAKTEPTKVKRIAQALNGLSRKQNFGEMLRELKNKKTDPV